MQQGIPTNIPFSKLKSGDIFVYPNNTATILRKIGPSSVELVYSPNGQPGSILSLDPEGKTCIQVFMPKPE